jgi:geranylgeranyl diphosphate synthase type I
MIWEIKNRIEKELSVYLKSLDRLYSLNRISPILSSSIQNFACRKGKRVRPILFVIGYLGFAKKEARGLYTSAVSLELLHDFLLVHDDIIDKSETRRGELSMHTMLNRYLAGHKNIKFDGNDLAIVAGDVMYALAIHSFLSVKEEKERKEMALKKLIEAAIHTGSGEFIELLYGIESIEQTTKDDIYKIYDYKTAHYTFSAPLTIGATLAGAKKTQVDMLFNYGKYLGRAFQIKDDILGMFGKEEKIGKSILTDLREGKKTILIWYAYYNSDRKNRLAIKRMLAKKNADKSDLAKMRKIIIAAKALDYAKNQVDYCLRRAQQIIAHSRMRPAYKKTLENYSQGLLKL